MFADTIQLGYGYEEDDLTQSDYRAVVRKDAGQPIAIPHGSETYTRTILINSSEKYERTIGGMLGFSALINSISLTTKGSIKSTLKDSTDYLFCLLIIAEKTTELAMADNTTKLRLTDDALNHLNSRTAGSAVTGLNLRKFYQNWSDSYVSKISLGRLLIGVFIINSATYSNRLSSSLELGIESSGIAGIKASGTFSRLNANSHLFSDIKIITKGFILKNTGRSEAVKQCRDFNDFAKLLDQYVPAPDASIIDFSTSSYNDLLLREVDRAATLRAMPVNDTLVYARSVEDEFENLRKGVLKKLTNWQQTYLDFRAYTTLDLASLDGRGNFDNNSYTIEISSINSEYDRIQDKIARTLHRCRIILFELDKPSIQLPTAVGAPLGSAAWINAYLTSLLDGLNEIKRDLTKLDKRIGSLCQNGTDNQRRCRTLVACIPVASNSSVKFQLPNVPKEVVSFHISIRPSNDLELTAASNSQQGALMTQSSTTIADASIRLKGCANGWFHRWHPIGDQITSTNSNSISLDGRTSSGKSFRDAYNKYRFTCKNKEINNVVFRLFIDSKGLGWTDTSLTTDLQASVYDIPAFAPSLFGSPHAVATILAPAGGSGGAAASVALTASLTP